MSYSPSATRWFLAGFDSGRNVGAHEGHAAGFREGHAAGHAAGFAAGIEHAADARAAETDAFNRALAADLSTAPTYVELATRRGEPERAARQRRHLDRIAATPGPYTRAEATA